MQIPNGVEKKKEKKQVLPLKHNPVSALAVLYTWGRQLQIHKHAWLYKSPEGHMLWFSPMAITVRDLFSVIFS